MKSEFQSLISSNGVKSSKSLKDTVLMYVYYWPLLVISLLICLGLGYVYIRYAVPLYSANTIINVRGETTNSKNSQASGDLINNAMNGGRSAINLDNELGRLRSARLMAQVVRNSDLNISYYRRGTFGETDIYHAAPLRLIQKDIQDSSSSIQLTITKPSEKGFTLHYGGEEKGTTKSVTWNEPFSVNGNTFILTPQASGWNPEDKYLVIWNPILITVYELLPKVAVNVIGKTSNIALSTTIENPKRGEDLLNKMVAAFIQMNLDDQNRNAQDKIYFIEDRLGKIAEELKGVEKTQAGYQGDNLMVGDNASTYGIPVGQAQLEVDKINTQKSTLNMVKTALNSAEGRVLPTGGISDGALSTLVGSYNDALLKRQSLAPQVAPNSLILKEVEDKIRDLKANIYDNLNNNIRALDLQAANYSRQGSQFRSSVSILPEKQRILNEITREKTIKESLYMYLLQKREETALSKTTTTPYEQIDLATSYGPVSPNKKSIYAYAAVIGLLIPVGIIFLLSMINDKIKGREEVENAAKAQIVGEINYIKRTEDKFLPSLKGGIVGEQFRIMRANLNFLQKGATEQVILITSSGSGEGKSFISLNLAAVLSKTGKKVALLDFDLRKPDESLPTALNGKGLKDYLLGEAMLDEIVQPVGELPTLHLYPSGQVIADVGDLIVSEKADELFDELKTKYDVIVINTPPVGLVGDALILQKYSTLIGFVIREGFTKKKQLQYLNSLIETGKFANTCVIYNGVRIGMKYGYYGYGYTKDNSYFDRNGNGRIVNVFKRKRTTPV
jgi:capsular exopolysaccharide synthesis family protein